MSEPKIETFGNKSDLKKKLKKSKQSIAMLQKKLRLLMVRKVSGQKAVSQKVKMGNKENDDDRWDRADNFTKMITRTGKERKVISRATSVESSKSRKSEKKKKKRSASVCSVKK